jgi:hypothetical protein
MVSQDIIRQDIFDRMHFQTVAQLKAIDKQYQRTMDAHGYYVEPFFWHPDGTMDYQRFLEVTHELISVKGSHDLLRDIDKHPRALRHRGMPGFWAHAGDRTLNTAVLAKDFIESAVLPWMERKLGDTCTIDMVEDVMLLPFLDFVAWGIVKSGPPEVQARVTGTLILTITEMLPKLVQRRAHESA